jgi:hypothetical protein
MKVVLLLAVLLVPAQTDLPVPAGTTDEFRFLTGNTLLEKCQSESTVDRGDCQGYITGVFDMIGYQQKGISMQDRKPLWRLAFVCMPDAADTKQIRDVVVKYLEDNPATRADLAAALIVKAAIKSRGFPTK